MPTYRVRWEIDEDAPHFLHAARQARARLLNPDSIATVFHVEEHSPNARPGLSMMIDLGAEDAEAPAPEPVNAALLAALKRMTGISREGRVQAAGAPYGLDMVRGEAQAAIAAAEKAPQARPIVVKVRGGLVDEVEHIPPGLSVQVWDYDVEGEPYEDEEDDPSDHFDADEEGKLHGCVEFTGKEG